MSLSVLVFKELPCDLVVLLAVEAVEGGNVLNGPLNWPAGHCVVSDGAFNNLPRNCI